MADDNAPTGLMTTPTPEPKPSEITAASLTKCPGCGNDVSRVAVACPRCGQPISEQKQQGVYVPIVPPRQFLVGNFLACLLLVGGAGWLAFAWLPAHDAAALGMLDQVTNVVRGQLLLNADGVNMVRAAAFIAALIGLAGMPSSFREVGRAEQCARCAMQVVSRRKLLGRFACERCGTTLSGAFGALVRGLFLLLLLGTIGLAGLALAIGKVQQRSERGVGGTSGPAPTEPWDRRAAAVMNRILEDPVQGQELATGILGITHPSGGSPTLLLGGASRASALTAGTLDVTIVVCWKGGLIGTDYTTFVKWQCNARGHISAAVSQDDAPIGQDNESAERLNSYFETVWWPTLLSNTGGR